MEGEPVGYDKYDPAVYDYVYQIALSLRVVLHDPPLPASMVQWHKTFLDYWGIPYESDCNMPILPPEGTDQAKDSYL